MSEEETYKRFQQSPLGGIVEMSNPFPTQAVSVNVDPLVIPDRRERILEANLLSGDSQLYSSGSWVLTLDSFADFGGTAVPNTILPIRAIVELGTGGARQAFEVDARNTSFQLPAANITVDISWDETLPVFGDAFTNSWQMPDKVRVIATLQRGVSNGQATRTIWLPYQSAATSTAEGLIPNFAKCMRVWSATRGGIPFFTAGGTGKIELVRQPANSFSQNIMMTYPGENLIDPAGVPVPTLAQFYKYDSGGNGGPSSIEFEISL